MKQLLLICFLASFLVSTWAVCNANASGAQTCGTQTDPLPSACLSGYKLTSTACVACAAGEWNDDGATTSTCVQCTAGFICDGKNAAGAAPTTGTSADATGTTITKKACPAGHYCPEGTGSVAATGAAGEAKPCPEGFGSAAGTTSAAGAVQMDNAATGCDKTCAVNIKNCSGTGATEAISCKSKYVLNTNACEECTADPNVDTCPQATKTTDVTTCKAGYFQVAKTGTETKDKCDACADGCFACTSKTVCTAAKKGYQFIAAAPTKCDGTGKTNLTDNHTSADCATDCAETPAAGQKMCLTCNVAADKCTQCKPNFEVTAEAKCASIATTKHATCHEADKAADDTACTACDAALQREPAWNTAAVPAETRGKCKCKAGFREPEATATDKQCVECGKEVATCDKDQALTCKTPTTHKVAGKDCFAFSPVDATLTGHFYDTTAAMFKACDATCATCSGAGATACKTCTPLTPPSVLPKEGDANFAKYLKTAFFANATCFKECPAGFKADSAQALCVADDGAAANSVLFSALALIFSLFLIF